MRTTAKKEIDYDEVIEKMTQLLVKSEERIEKTNDMICKLVTTIDKLTDEYSKHIDKLQDTREELIKQNNNLLKLVESCRRESELTNRRYDTLLEKSLLFSGLNNGKSENNINVR